MYFFGCLIYDCSYYASLSCVLICYASIFFLSCLTKFPSPLTESGLLLYYFLTYLEYSWINNSIVLLAFHILCISSQFFIVHISLTCSFLLYSHHCFLHHQFHFLPRICYLFAFLNLFSSHCFSMDCTILLYSFNCYLFLIFHLLFPIIISF